MDGALLDQFVREGNQEAFAGLLERHGPYVLSICRHLTAHAQDAEDVFQACFLELVRRAASIRQKSCLAGWLQTVATRLARKARAQSLKRQKKEKQAASSMRKTATNPEEISWREACRILEEEIGRLPEELRLPIILCLFEGKSQEEAGLQLRINTRTVKDRTRRGREQLQRRLSQRGVTLSVLGVLLSAGSGEAAIPATLRELTLQGARAVANQSSLTGVVSHAVIRLADSGFSIVGWGLAAVALVASVVTASTAYVAWNRYHVSPPAPTTDVGSASTRRAPRTIHRSFRGEQFDAQVFQWSGADTHQFTRREVEGLRITLPAVNGPANAVGVKLRFPVRGDFELEATLELIDAVEPVVSGAGATVYLFMDSADRDGVWLGKVRDRMGAVIFNVGQRVNADAERSTKFIKTAAAKRKDGLARFRIVRKGPQFTVFVAEGEMAEFKLFHEFEVSDADLTIVRLAADPARAANAAIDVRLVDFTITAAEFVGY